MKKLLVFSTSFLLILTGCAQTNDGDHIHELSFHKAKAATCTEDGHEAYFECELCHKFYSDDLAENEITSPANIPATGHGDNLHHFPAKEGTCVDTGFEEYYECYACDKLYSDSEGTIEIDTPISSGYGAHQLKHIPEVPGGCLSYTILEHYECELCHKLFIDNAGKNETSIEELQTGTLSSHNLTLVQGSPKTNFVDGTKTHYECSACHTKFLDQNGSTAIDEADINEVSDAWVRFGFSTATNTSNVVSTAVTMKDKIFDENKDIKGTKVTFKQALNLEQSFIHDTNGHDNSTSGVNPRIRLVSGKQLTYKLYVKNTGANDLKFRVCYNDNNNESGPIVDVKAGQEVTISETINHTHGMGTRGGWIKIIAKGNIPAGSSYETYGYYKSKDYLPFDDVNNCFEIQRGATKKVFSVGEKFNSDGLLLRMYEQECTSNTDTGYVTSYETNYDGYTFKDSDIGTKTVYVKFGGVVRTYEIEVAAYHATCNLSLVKGTPATNWSNGTSDYYACSECDKIYLDAQGTQETSYNALRVSKGAWVRTINKDSIFDNPNVGVAYVDVQDEILDAGQIKATEISFKSDLNKGASWQHTNNWDDSVALSKGVNNRFPLMVNKAVDYKTYYKNTGTSTLSFKFYIWNDDEPSVSETITLEPGESKIISRTYTTTRGKGTGSGWSKFVLTENASSGAKFVSYTYYSTTNNNNMDFRADSTVSNYAKITKVKDPTIVAFRVGDLFTSTGLVFQLTTGAEAGTNSGYIYNFDTNFDGHRFTASDVGTHTVTVRFADATYTYNIQVRA